MKKRSQTVNQVLLDYAIGYESRQASLLGRREVLSGKAKFGIFGDGKEVAQMAMARSFKKGDWRSGYYRDQTFMFAIGESDVQKFFAQLYAHTDVQAEPSSAGRSMNGHFGTRFLDDEGAWLSQSDRYNVSADVSPTGSQMPRLVGLAQASKMYREAESLKEMTQFSNNGNEVAFGTIGNASCAEGMFWESVNAIGVLKVPAVISIWDDGYGISVPNSVQVTKSNVGELLQGFQRKPGTTDGYDIHVVSGWNYSELVEVYAKATAAARNEHVPQIIHVIEVTQPQGHSTSGSHERYKTPERMEWEKEFDCLTRMRAWMLEEKLATEKEIVDVEEKATARVRELKGAAWDAYTAPIMAELKTAVELYSVLRDELVLLNLPEVAESVAVEWNELVSIREPFRRDIMVSTHKVLQLTASANCSSRNALQQWRKSFNNDVKERYESHLYSEGKNQIANVHHVDASYDSDSQSVNG
ncbi:MAG: transketolase, partial [Ignavibacteria bacterium]|nr:transketolase [Ignavibacteria bacterium]